MNKKKLSDLNVTLTGFEFDIRGGRHEYDRDEQVINWKYCDCADSFEDAQKKFSIASDYPINTLSSKTKYLDENSKMEYLVVRDLITDKVEIFHRPVGQTIWVEAVEFND